MHHFRDGEEARVQTNGMDLAVVVFRQLGESVYAFDGANRAYQFHVNDVSPAVSSSISAQSSRERMAHIQPKMTAAIPGNVSR